MPSNKWVAEADGDGQQWRTEPKTGGYVCIKVVWRSDQLATDRMAWELCGHEV